LAHGFDWPTVKVSKNYLNLPKCLQVLGDSQIV
jgi:hypothetical protein